MDIREPPPEVLEAHSREVMDRLDRLIKETEAVPTGLGRVRIDIIGSDQPEVRSRGRRR